MIVTLAGRTFVNVQVVSSVADSVTLTLREARFPCSPVVQLRPVRFQPAFGPSVTVYVPGLA